MVQTEFSVRCSGRIEYAGAIVGAAALSCIFIKLHNWINFPLEIVLAIIAVFSIASIVVSFIKAKIQYIEVDSEGVTMHSGLFNKKTTYVPYERITNIHTHKSLLERIFGLGGLQVDTAGTNKVEINMGNIPSKYLGKLVRAVQKNIIKGEGK